MFDQIIKRFVQVWEILCFCLDPDVTLKMGFEKDLMTKIPNTDYY